MELFSERVAQIETTIVMTDPHQIHADPEPVQTCLTDGVEGKTFRVFPSQILIDVNYETETPILYRPFQIVMFHLLDLNWV